MKVYSAVQLPEYGLYEFNILETIVQWLKSQLSFTNQNENMPSKSLIIVKIMVEESPNQFCVQAGKPTVLTLKSMEVRMMR